MITVHALAHVKEKQHDKGFYKLCCHMEPEPQYHQVEFDLRLVLTHIDMSGEGLLAEMGCSTKATHIV